MSELDGYSAAPTEIEKEQIADSSQELNETMSALHTLIDKDLSNLNNALNQAGVPHVTAVPLAQEGPPRGR